MPGLALFGWGFLGGSIAAVVIYVLPELIYAARTGAPDESVTRNRVAFTLVLVFVLAVIGGVVSLVIEPASRSQAIGLGLAAQAIIKGLIAAGQEATRPPN